MVEYRIGIEDLPLPKYDKDPFPIAVFVIDLKNDDNVVAQYELDYSSFEDRKKLGRITYTAVKNGYSVETMSMKDANGESNA